MSIPTALRSTVRCSGRWETVALPADSFWAENTFRAGLCLASLAEVKGKEYILVTAKAEDAGDAHVTDALKVYGQIGEQ